VTGRMFFGAVIELELNDESGYLLPSGFSASEILSWLNKKVGWLGHRMMNQQH
jgi:hypothetical protein